MGVDATERMEGGEDATGRKVEVGEEEGRSRRGGGEEVSGGEEER